jgi:hypothetical protein
MSPFYAESDTADSIENSSVLNERLAAFRYPLTKGLALSSVPFISNFLSRNAAFGNQTIRLGEDSKQT